MISSIQYEQVFRMLEVQCDIIMQILWSILYFSSPIFATFLVGRVREGQFEYPRLNGLLTKETAKLMCDRDKMCGGFTYKGSLESKQKHEVFFFHMVINIDARSSSWNWVTYRPDDRSLVKFSAIPKYYQGHAFYQVQLSFLAQQ